MKRRYTFDDAQKGIKGTPVPIDPNDPNDPTILFLLKELFNDLSMGQVDPVSLPSAASAPSPAAPQE